MEHQAIARSAVLANHSNNGLTAPGLKKVPMPGCANRCERESEFTMRECYGT